ncbi:MAG: ABC transporter substrate-binding protein, partial [Deltaproteobacteria bacterium]
MLVLFVSLAFLLSLAPNLFAEEGVTDTEIHIGSWGPQTGPGAAWGAVPRGTGAYFQWINDNGGIHGRKIVYHMFDDGYNPAKTKAGVKELQEGTGMFAWVGGVGTSPGLAVRDYLAKKNVPWVGPSAGSLHWVEPPQKNLFAVYPLYA